MAGMVRPLALCASAPARLVRLYATGQRLPRGASGPVALTGSCALAEGGSHPALGMGRGRSWVKGPTRKEPDQAARQAIIHGHPSGQTAGCMGLALETPGETSLEGAPCLGRGSQRSRADPSVHRRAGPFSEGGFGALAIAPCRRLWACQDRLFSLRLDPLGVAASGCSHRQTRGESCLGKDLPDRPVCRRVEGLFPLRPTARLCAMEPVRAAGARQVPTGPVRLRKGRQVHRCPGETGRGQDRSSSGRLRLSQSEGAAKKYDDAFVLCKLLGRQMRQGDRNYACNARLWGLRSGDDDQRLAF
jgi:hypothetical protein